MPLSRLEMVMIGLHKSLKQIPRVDVADLSTAREDNTAIDKFPTLVVLDDGGRLVERTHGHALYRAAWKIEGYVSASRPTEADEALVELYAQTIKALYADETLAGVAAQIFEGERVVERVAKSEGVKPHMVFTLSGEVEYLTAPTDPYAAPDPDDA